MVIRNTALVLMCNLVLLASCTYFHYVGVQRGYSHQQSSAPRLRTYKHLIDSPSYFVFGKVNGPRPGSSSSLAVLAVSDRYSRSEIVDINHLAAIDTYYGLNLPPGQYRLLVVCDLDGDGYYVPSEIIASRELSLPESAGAETVVGDIDLLLDPAATHSVPFADFHVPAKPPAHLQESALYPRGTIRSLDDEIFSPDLGTLGMYEPAAFLERAPMMFYALEEDVAYKIPVILVHGITGSPRDFKELIERLDRKLYRPWFFYYPGGTNLAQLSEFFYRIFLSGKVIALQGMPIVIVAHSMGGLVVRDALNRYDGGGNEPPSVRFITLASPMGGMASAAAAATAPMTVPSWRDLAPGSDFLNRLHRKPLRNVEYDLIYAYGRSPTATSRAGYDGVVPLTSQLDRAARREASHVVGIAATHMGILSDPDAMSSLLKAIESVRPPFSDEQLAELLKGGFPVAHSERFTRIEQHIIESEGYFLQALAAGTLSPSNPLQAHFVEVLAGRQSPMNEAETAWLKFSSDPH